jgi:hypothetical protein
MGRCRFGAEDAHLSVADIVDATSRAEVQAYKQQIKAQAKARR